MTEALTVLDCTLRDGGYYTNWIFPRPLVEDYLAACSAAGIDVVEIGFRYARKDQFLGPYAYMTDNFLATLPLPAGLRIGVMVNAADLLAHGDGPAAAIHQLFQPAERSPVSLVRIAANADAVAACEPAVRALESLGYGIGFNIMQITRSTPAAISQVAERIAGWTGIEVLYFADSLGNMRDGQVRACCEALRRGGWRGPLGIHAHDNMGRALINTLEAVDAGAAWVDGTILGMGRGAGNARTEFLLCEVARREPRARRNVEALLPLVAGDFPALQRLHGWGANLLYFLSAQNDIHPTYVQTMQAEGRFDATEILGALNTLKSMKGYSFSIDTLVRALGETPSAERGTWTASGWLDGRDVLLLAPGAGSVEHGEALVDYIRRERPAVLCLNLATAIPRDLITAYVACHPQRILMEQNSYRTLGRPLVVPTAFLPDAPKDVTLDYGLRVGPGQFEAGPQGCVVPVLLVAVYALAVATASGARRILLAGFDGYGAADARQMEMVKAFELYHAMPGARPVVAITPTAYPVTQSSVYAPEV